MPSERILVVEDETDLAWLLCEDLQKTGYQTILAHDGVSAYDLFLKEIPDLVISDIRLPKMDGLDLLKKILTSEHQVPVIIMTGYGSMEAANKAVQIGAHSYLEKPFNRQSLVFAVNKALESRLMSEEMTWLREEARKQIAYDDFIGNTSKMRQLVKLVEKVSSSDAPTVLLEGESGTGKNFFAHMIHNKSSRTKNPFMEINCASIPENLIESELFGHERGAFTDAKQLKRGLFEVAKGGTIFLDEIGEMTLATQAKLLHVIENHTLRRVGGNESIATDVRVIAATCCNLKEAVQAKRFREDLYFRLRLIPLTIPPLREHADDLPVLLEYFMTKFNKEYGRSLQGVTPEAMVFLKTYPWPGNIRELKNLVERIAILENSPVIGISHLPVEIRSGGKTNVSNPDEPRFNIPDRGMSLEDVEKNFIMDALKRTAGNQSKAAKLLGLTRHTLRYRMDKFGIRGM